MSLQHTDGEIAATDYENLPFPSYPSPDDIDQFATSYFGKEPLTTERMVSLLRDERRWHLEQTHTITSSFRDTCEALCRYLENYISNSIKNLKEELFNCLPDSVAGVVSSIVAAPGRLAPKNSLLPSSQTPSDDSIISLWRQITFNIENLASKFAQCECRMPNELHRNGPLYSLDFGLNSLLFCGEQSTCESIQLLIWKYVTQLVFNNDADVWLRNSTRSWVRARRELIDETLLKEGDLSKFTAWMVQMPGIEQLEGSAEKISRVACNESQKLMQFLKHPSQSLLKVSTRDLEQIIHDAVKLEAIFSASKAIFEVDWMVQTGNLEFKKNEMEAASSYDESLAGAKVLYICRPLLRKIGNVDGKFYDSSQVLVKAGAVCQLDSESYTCGTRPSPVIVDD